MEAHADKQAAQLLVENTPFSGGDHNRPSDMLMRFKRWQKGQIRASNEHAYPEFTGYYDFYLLQMWRDTSRQNAHYVARGNLATGDIDAGVLYDVVEMSRHQDISELSQERQREVRYYLEMQPLRDFPDLHGLVKLGGVASALYASPDRITITEANCEEKRVGDLVKLDTDMYHIRQAMSTIALEQRAA